jgi:hypothetical protein
MGLGALALDVAGHAKLATRFGWGGVLAMELERRPSFLKRHHLEGLLNPPPLVTAPITITPTPTLTPTARSTAPNSTQSSPPQSWAPAGRPPVAPTPLLPSLNPQTEVSGQVVDASGRPLAGVPVGVGSDTTTTDGEGRFVLADLPANPGALMVDGQHSPSGAYMMLMAPSSQFLVHPVYTKVNNFIPAPIILLVVDLQHATDFSKVDASQT